MKAINCLILLLLMTLKAQTQNVMTSSPYSMFGIGELQNGLYGQNAGMGGVAYGMRNNVLMNIENPAGLTALDSKRLLTELSIFAKNESYTSGSSSNQAFTGSFSALMLGGRVIPRWYMAVSLTPYSSVGYYFHSSQPIEGAPHESYAAAFTGSGGISKVSWSNAYLLSQHWSLGANISYLFGNIVLSEQQSDLVVEKRMHARSLYANLGIQYHRALTHDMSYTWGVVYGYRQKLNITNRKYIVNDKTQDKKKQKSQKQSLPQYFGIGGAVQYKKCTYAMDYAFQQYSSLTSVDSRIKFRDVNECRIGICYFPNGYPSDSFWKRVAYKTGVNISNSYMEINGNPGFSLRLNAGLSLPVFRGRIDAAVFYDRTQLRKGALNRDVVGITVSFALNEIFYKGKLK
jgi:hypothetical protein